jgi:NAD(P)H-hydrate epimerase
LEADALGDIEKKINAYRPLIVDADALNLLSKSAMIKQYFLPEKVRHDNWILTPHPAEAGRLLGCSTSEVQDDRVNALQKLHTLYQGVIVLKGSGTLTLGSSNIIRQCTEGNPGMATAGMGDILTGIIGGLTAQHLSLEQAANLGVCAHAAAGDLAAYQQGQRGLNARDILGPLRKCLKPIS